jgi:hypothetical protein
MSNADAVKLYATEVLKQHRFKATALPQLRAFDGAWQESKGKVVAMMDAGAVAAGAGAGAGNRNECFGE